MKKQREQQKISVLAGEAQEYLRTIQAKVENPEFQSQISGWIAVLDTWRRIWETQEKENPQPVKKKTEAILVTFRQSRKRGLPQGVQRTAAAGSEKKQAKSRATESNRWDN